MRDFILIGVAALIGLGAALLVVIPLARRLHNDLCGLKETITQAQTEEQQRREESEAHVQELLDPPQRPPRRHLRGLPVVAALVGVVGWMKHHAVTLAGTATAGVTALAVMVPSGRDTDATPDLPDRPNPPVVSTRTPAPPERVPPARPAETTGTAARPPAPQTSAPRPAPAPQPTRPAPTSVSPTTTPQVPPPVPEPTPDPCLLDLQLPPLLAVCL